MRKLSHAKSFILFVFAYMALSLLFFWIVKDDWRRTAVFTDPVNRDLLLPELTAEDEIRQDFLVASDHLDSLVFQVNKQDGAPNNGIVQLAIINQEQEELFSCEIPYSAIDEKGLLSIPIEENEKITKGSIFTAVLRAEGKLSFWYGRSKSAGKFQVDVETSGLLMNKEFFNGELVMTQQGVNDLIYMDYYWKVVLGLFVILVVIILYCRYCTEHDKKNMINKGLFLVKQYQYLLKTLVVRDFKIKYKASLLGVLWSFLNPLLMTLVYMFVFSTLFRNSIENFVVYLMSGIILFNYFSESTNLGMQSIVGNASLIKKVYIPKYVFPISKVLSSGINLFISLIPLLIIMAITGVRFGKSLLLIPLVMIFLILFCVGVSLILSAVIVYFRDIQFLWGILITILNFLSPVFYPETIIPARFLTMYHMNPMYQILFFMRTITLGGISPTPGTYLYCFLASGITLLVGICVFRKAQGSFVLHL